MSLSGYYRAIPIISTSIFQARNYELYAPGAHFDDLLGLPEGFIDPVYDM